MACYSWLLTHLSVRICIHGMRFEFYLACCRIRSYFRIEKPVANRICICEYVRVSRVNEVVSWYNAAMKAVLTTKDSQGIPWLHLVVKILKGRFRLIGLLARWADTIGLRCLASSLSVHSTPGYTIEASEFACGIYIGLLLPLMDIEWFEDVSFMWHFMGIFVGGTKYDYSITNKCCNLFFWYVEECGICFWTTIAVQGNIYVQCGRHICSGDICQ